MIKKGTPCFITQLGHNNFHYPVYNEEGLTYFEQDVEEFQLKAWVCSQTNLRAVFVDTVPIKDLYGSDKTVVWVEKKYLNSSKN
jgi:hypothetical protein